MTEATSNELTPELLVWLETWRTATQQVLSQVSGKTVPLEISPEPASMAASDLWYTVTAEAAARGEMTFRATPETGLRLAQMFMGETEPASGELTAEYKEALEELLRQIAGVVATTMSLPAGKVQFRVAASAAPSWPAVASACLRSPAGSTPILSIAIQFSATLAESLQVHLQEQAPSPSPPVATISPQPAGSYDRLMDVGLEVKLRFGTRRMVLRDVLAR